MAVSPEADSKPDTEVPNPKEPQKEEEEQPEEEKKKKASDYDWVASATQVSQRKKILRYSLELTHRFSIPGQKLTKSCTALLIAPSSRLLPSPR